MNRFKVTLLLEANLAKYQQIEDPVERERAVAACEGMIADFLDILEKIEV